MHGTVLHNHLIGVPYIMSASKPKDHFSNIGRGPRSGTLPPATGKRATALHYRLLYNFTQGLNGNFSTCLRSYIPLKFDQPSFYNLALRFRISRRLKKSISPTQPLSERWKLYSEHSRIWLENLVLQANSRSMIGATVGVQPFGGVGLPILLVLHATRAVPAVLGQ